MKTKRQATRAMLAATAGAWLCVHPLASQQQPEGRFEERLVVSEVLLDAVVTDQRDQVILGLGKSDFVVKEDGREVEILGVSFYSAYERVPAQPLDLPGFDLDQVPADRHFILFIQEIGGAGSVTKLRARLQRAGAALEEWVATGLTPNDLVAVVGWGSKLKIHQDFTRDRSSISRAIDSAVRGRDPEAKWPSRQRPASEIGPLLARLPTGKPLRRATGSLYRGLSLLAHAASGVAGRKNLVYLGTGFDTLDDSYPFRLGRTTQALNDANVAVYTLDLLPSEIRHSSRASLRTLALATGGDLFFNFVSFASPLERIASRTAGYYLIAYRSEHPAGRAGYQRVKVETTNPELRVRARSGYSFGGEGPTDR